jgi:hypothetical protein
MADPFVFTRSNLFSDEAKRAMRRLPKGWFNCAGLPTPYTQISARVWKKGIQERLYINVRTAPNADGFRREGYLGWIDLRDVKVGEGKARLIIKALNAISSRKTTV